MTELAEVKILIVDDITANLELAAVVLRNNGFKTAVAGDGETAIKRSEYLKPDLILLDIMMPGIDGYETCRRLKANDATSDIPVIFMSALSDTVDKVKGFKAGGVDFISKPFQAEELLARVQTHLTIRSLQKKLVDKKESAEEANRAKSDFLSNMGHEIRTPLNAVIGFAQILTRRDDMPADAIIDIQRIYRSGQHLLGLINDVLDMAKIEAGKLVLNEGSVNFHLLVDDTYQMFLPKMKEKGLIFEIVGLENVPTYLKCDERKVKQVLLNLLSNSYKFTDSGQISLHFQYLNDMLYIEVCDSGKGIDELELDTVFEKFIQTRSGLESQQGTGLGLSISREFARLMGGNLSVKSVIGEGSVFTFLFEAVKVSSVNADKPQKVIGLSAGQPEYRILIVDDNELNREVLASFLRPLNFIIDMAESGEQAIDLCAASQPQLVFMDQHMPGMLGSEATRIIKAHYPAIKVVAFTASILEEDSHLLLAAGSEKVIRKPLQIDEVYSTLKDSLSLEYIYATQSEKQVTKTQHRNSINLRNFAQIDEEFVSQIKANCRVGDAAGLRRIANELDSVEPVISAFIKERLETYDFKGILHQFDRQPVNPNRLLIVDDQELNLIIAKELISDLGFEVELALSGEKALELYKLNAYPIVISDCEMPGINGFKLAETLMQFTNPPMVLGFTAGKEEKFNQCLESGMINVLSKPLLEEEMEKILKPLLK